MRSQLPLRLARRSYWRLLSAFSEQDATVAERLGEPTPIRAVFARVGAAWALTSTLPDPASPPYPALKRAELRRSLGCDVPSLALGQIVHVQSFRELADALTAARTWPRGGPARQPTPAGRRVDSGRIVNLRLTP